MAICIKDSGMIRLATQLAALTGESKTEAIRKALDERLDRLSRVSSHRMRRAELVRVLGCKVPAMIRAGSRRRGLTPEEVQELLAYGP